jgi:uncharacterized membrane protein YphA (DoxX/SURF4 family)
MSGVTMKELHHKAQPWLNLLGRLVLGVVLLLAGYLKAKSPAEAAMAVRAYEVLPISVANILGYSLPWFEIGVGLLLIIGVSIKKSAIFGGALMLLFIVAISQAWARGLSIDCGCFGSGGQVAPGKAKYLQEILRDAGLTAIAIYLFRYPHGKLALDKSPEASA